MTTPEYELLSKLARPALATQRTHIPLVEEADASDALAAVYSRFRKSFGRSDIPPTLTCFSSSPELLDSIVRMSSLLLFSDGVLGRRTKEMIASLVSRLNECPYCLDSHAFFLRAHGGEALVEPLVKGQLDSPELPEKDRALLDFVSKVNDASHSIRLDDIDLLRNAGWADDQIAEAVHLGAIFAFFNRVANAFGLVSQGLLEL